MSEAGTIIAILGTLADAVFSGIDDNYEEEWEAEQEKKLRHNWEETKKEQADARYRAKRNALASAINSSVSPYSEPYVGDKKFINPKDKYESPDWLNIAQGITDLAQSSGSLFTSGSDDASNSSGVNTKKYDYLNMNYDTDPYSSYA